MEKICSYCKKNMGDCEPFGETGISHGMCDTCFASFDNQLDGVSLENYIEKFDLPVLIVNEDARILAANRLAQQTIDKPIRDMIGSHAGNVMECAHARLPEGCGNTVHCLGCTIRNTINEVTKSNDSRLHVSAVLSQDEKNIDMVLSAEKIDSFIQITIEQINKDIISNGYFS